MTRRQLAQARAPPSATSRRSRAGRAIPSVIMLKAIARGARRSGRRAVAAHQRPHGRDDPHPRCSRSRCRRPNSPAIAELIEARAAEATIDRPRAADRAGRTARRRKVDARTAASLTVLAVPFIELDRLVEQDYGARIPDLIEMAGIATFRRYERACLERVIAENEAAVIATAGGIVSNAETYALLLRRTHTVWIKARPDEHMAPRDGAGRLPSDGAEPRGDGRPGRHSGCAQRRLRARGSRTRHRRAIRSSRALRSWRRSRRVMRGGDRS